MIVKAQGKFLRISPTKARRVIDLLRGKDAVVARAILSNINNRPREYLRKILDSAIANAKVKGFRPEQLYVSMIICDVGPIWKRYKAAAFGRATPIKRRTSHIRIELDLKSK
jgi:large subunit ribosomal protein L22